MKENKWYCLKCGSCEKIIGVSDKKTEDIIVCKDCVLEANKAVIIEKICIN